MKINLLSFKNLKANHIYRPADFHENIIYDYYK